MRRQKSQPKKAPRPPKGALDPTRLRLHRKGCAAAAAGRRVWIFDHKPRPNQLIREINHRIGQKRQRHAVDHDALSVAFQDHVVLGRGVQIDLVLKPGTSAAFHGHAQRLSLIGCANLGQAGKGAICDFWGQAEHFGHSGRFRFHPQDIRQSQ